MEISKPLADVLCAWTSSAYHYVSRNRLHSLTMARGEDVAVHWLQSYQEELGKQVLSD